MKYIKSLAALLLLAIHTYSQEVKSFSIGDKVPEIIINNILNYKSCSARLSDFKDKLLILDFWNTGCAPCIKALPKMDSLQQQFMGRLQILAVAPEKEAVITRLLNKRWPGSMALTLPFVVGDSLLINMFQYGAVPHEVWIKGGKIIAITDDLPVTAANIRQILDGQAVNMPMKFRFDFYPTDKPLLSDGGNPNMQELLYQSVLTHRVENVKGTGDSFIDPGDRTYRYYRYAYSVKKLFLTAFDPERQLGEADNRVILENVKDSSRYMTPDKNDIEKYIEWQKNNLFNYELMFAVSPDNKDVKERISVIMQRDLNNFFGDLYGLRGSFEKRKVSCLAVTLLPAFQASDEKPDLYILGANTKVWKGQPLSRILKDIAWSSNRLTNGFFPVILDETNFSGNTSMILDDASMKDMITLKKALYKYGLELKETYRELNMVVLTETAN